MEVALKGTCALVSDRLSHLQTCEALNKVLNRYTFMLQKSTLKCARRIAQYA